MILPLLEAAAGEENSLELPNFVHWIAKTMPGTKTGEFLHSWVDVIFSWIVILILALLFSAASRNRKMIPGQLQNIAEIAVQWLYDLVTGVMGPRGKAFVPFLGSIFLYIFVSNIFGLIPLMKSPTSNLNTTLALALVVFVVAQAVGMIKLGPLGYLDHMAGQPRDPIGWIMVPLLMPIHVIGELAKPVSLSCRLFGNIFGEDMVLAAFIGLGITVAGALHFKFFGVPLHLPFIFLAMLTSLIQALVFTLLSTIYIFLMLPHEHAHDGHEVEDALAPGYPVPGEHA